MFLDSAVRCAVNSGSPAVITTTKLAPSATYRRVACTFDGSTMTVYFDGIVAGVNTVATPVPVAAVTTQTTIGQSEPPGNGEQLAGAIDELEIWSTLEPP